MTFLLRVAGMSFGKSDHRKDRNRTALPCCSATGSMTALIFAKKTLGQFEAKPEERVGYLGEVQDSRVTNSGDIKTFAGVVFFPERMAFKVRTASSAILKRGCLMVVRDTGP